MIGLLESLTADIKLWMLGGILAVIIPVLGYLLAREFRRKDEIATRVEDLAERMSTNTLSMTSAIQALTATIHEIRAWSHERFVPRTEFAVTLDLMREDIKAHADRFEKDLDRCAKQHRRSTDKE